MSLCEDLLYLLGGFADCVLVPDRVVRSNLHHLPAGVDIELAPIAEPLACAFHAIDRAHIKPGESVAIVGGGALGLMLCALAADRGARPIVLDPHEQRRSGALQFGAVETITAARSTADVGAVQALTAGRGADQVFEAVGRPRSWELATEMVRPGGTVNMFGGCSRDATVALSSYRVHYEQITVQGSYHHSPACIVRSLQALATGAHPWEMLCGPRIGLRTLQAALEGRVERMNYGKATVIPGLVE